MTKQTGRKGKYSPEVVEIILGALKRGSTDKDAYTSAGISKDTYYQWIADKADFADAVSRAQASARHRAIEAIYAAFFDRDVTETTEETVEEPLLNSKREPVMDANGKPVMVVRRRTVQTVKTIAGDWRAGIEYLKRRDAPYWSERLQQISMNVNTDATASIDQETLKKAAEEMAQWVNEYRDSD